MTSVAADFDLIRRRIPGYEERGGQIRMADAVTAALAEHRHLIVEAPCGTGKTFAHLVPAIRHALATKTKVVICTANIALQEQLAEKDLPLLAKALPEPFSFALIKGIGNYLCLDRFEQVRGEGGKLAFDAEGLKRWKKIETWAKKTKTGDPGEMKTTPDDSTWAKINGVSELCTGAKCRYFDECHAMEARRRLLRANVIVTNYHLFFAHLKVKEAAERDVILPAYSAVICDEAQDLADIARDFFGRRLTPWTAAPIVKGAQHAGLIGEADRLRQASKEFFDEVVAHKRSGRYRIRLKGSPFESGAGLSAALKTLRQELAAMAKTKPDEETGDRIAKASGACDHYAEALDHFLDPDDENAVDWIDNDGRLLSRQIDVSEMLRERLFGDVPTVVLTSATLAAGGEGPARFSFLKRESGAADAEELVVDSPFDYRKQSILVVPKMRSEPRDPGFVDEMSGHINRILKRLGGRTMCLFTSYRNLERCADAARGLGVEILVQGEKPRSRLLDLFRKDRGSALFATASFWQGVDIPGEALSCLVIDKLPFLTPEDPLLDALQERDPRTFDSYSLPKAILSLRQGFGRLIRTKTDRGVVVIFDNRLFTARYGKQILASLPETEVHRDLAALDSLSSPA